MHAVVIGTRKHFDDVHNRSYSKKADHTLTLIGLVSTTCINAKATPINDTNYNCHITAVELL